MQRRMTRTRQLRSAEPCERFQGEDQEDFEERFINEFIGRGVFTTKTFSKDDFLLVYKGELVTADEGYRREDSYHPDLGSFLFFLKMVSILRSCPWSKLDRS
ncbi:unnamed protein product [Porites lobata]|uniref:Uncharacterized protein n=1 Tax=Porites lobata TaxID=104759 RepID=A0ABN8R3V7_9CNID|nr:unnamed protein product [Porites lobata]